METDLDKRYQTLIVLWFALLTSIGMYFLFSLFGPAVTADESSGSLFVTLTALGVLLVILSFVVKRKLLERSVETQDISLVQKSLVIACGMCEGSALLGLLERFMIDNRYYYLLFVFAAVGIGLHFPRRIQLQAASYRRLAPLN
jgi:Zn-dependent protease with chaperone function